MCRVAVTCVSAMQMVQHFIIDAILRMTLCVSISWLPVSGLVHKNSHTKHEVQKTKNTPEQSGHHLHRQSDRHCTVGVVPRYVRAGLLYETQDVKALAAHVDCVDDTAALRAALPALGLVSFIGDGSILPRCSALTILSS